MSGVNLSTWGSIPEGSERFIDESRGRQCCFMSLTALLVDGIIISPTRRIKREFSSEMNKLNSNSPNEKEKNMCIALRSEQTEF